MPRAETAVAVRDLWKTYRIRPRGQTRWWLPSPRADFHALKDVNLDVAEGSVVGVIGHNGAGKSTLLKVLSRITDPSRGEVRILGRVASLLEVGTGFHPELTGLENTFLNAAIHGLSRREVRARLADILEFAEVGDFIGVPVKRYSSGMYLRLAFSIAAHLDPDILLVDEILAVGDAAFQARCLGRFDELHRRGRTVVVVSHDLRLVERMCDEVVLLEAGSILTKGSTQDVLRRYHGSMLGSAVWTRNAPPTAKGPLLWSAKIVGPSGAEPTSTLNARAGGQISIEYELPHGCSQGRLYVRLEAGAGQFLLCSTSADQGASAFPRMEAGRATMVCRLPPDLLAPGSYRVSLGLALPDDRYEEVAHALSFDVTSDGSLLHAPFRTGLVAPLLSWARSPDDHPAASELGA